MTLTANTTVKGHRSAVVSNFKVVNADIAYASALMGLGRAGHASAGYVVPYAPAQYLCPIGFAQDAAVTGDTSATPVPEQSVEIGEHIRVLTVTGIGNTVLDVGRDVWPLTDNTFALIESVAYQIPIGTIVGNRSSTEVDVLIRSMSELLVAWHAEEVPTPTPTVTPSPTPTPT